MHLYLEYPDETDVYLLKDEVFERYQPLSVKHKVEERNQGQESLKVRRETNNLN